ncbi:MAG: hypothetical protein Q9174_007275 [Haloplaca sp. 1 TL-2023]
MKSAIALAFLPLLAHAYKGDMTHYTPGLGSCGHYDPPSAKRDVVALSREIMNNGANPNNNPKCGSKITIRNPRTKKTHTATIVDTCWACKKGDIDVNVELFYKVAPKGDGRVHGIEWSGPKVGRLEMGEDEWREDSLEDVLAAEGQEVFEYGMERGEEAEIKQEVKEMKETVEEIKEMMQGRLSRFFRNWNIWA